MDGLDASIGALYLDAVTNNPVQPPSVLPAHLANLAPSLAPPPSPPSVQAKIRNGKYDSC